MGRFGITIVADGTHHAEGHDTDADRMAIEFVQRLRAAGHTVFVAHFTHGDSDDLVSLPADSQRDTDVAEERCGDEATGTWMKHEVSRI